MVKQLYISLLVFVVTLPLLVSCGKKDAPGPPPGENFMYPKHYPKS